MVDTEVSTHGQERIEIMLPSVFGMISNPEAVGEDIGRQNLQETREIGIFQDRRLLTDGP